MVVDGMQSVPAGALATGATLEAAATLEEPADEFADPVEASDVAPPRVEAATLVPAASTAVKLENPWAIMT